MEWLLLAAIAALIVWQARRRRGRPSRVPGAGAGRYARFEGDGDFELDVVGEGSYQPALDKIVGGKTSDGHEFECEALLKRERDNPHDNNAVAVYIKRQKVGYLSRIHARRLTEILEAQNLDGGYANALIVGGWARRDGDEGSFGVKIDIPV